MFCCLVLGSFCQQFGMIWIFWISFCSKFLLSVLVVMFMKCGLLFIGYGFYLLVICFNCLSWVLLRQVWVLQCWKLLWRLVRNCLFQFVVVLSLVVLSSVVNFLIWLYCLRIVRLGMVGYLRLSLLLLVLLVFDCWFGVGLVILFVLVFMLFGIWF